MRVLVADDDPSLRFLCRAALESAGHEVLLAEDGMQVLDRLRVDAPELVLLDVNMPNMNGMDVLQQLRPDQRESVPFLLFSARSSVADRERGLELGATDYITKPFQPKELLKMVNDILQMPVEVRNQHRLMKLDRVKGEHLQPSLGEAAGKSSFDSADQLHAGQSLMDAAVEDPVRLLCTGASSGLTSQAQLKRASDQHMAISRLVELCASGVAPAELYDALASSFVSTLSFARVVVLEFHRAGSVQVCAAAGHSASSYAQRRYMRPDEMKAFAGGPAWVHIASNGIFADSIEVPRTEVWFAIPGAGQPIGLVAVDCAPGDFAHANDTAFVQTMTGVLSLALRGQRAEDRLISLIRADTT